MAQQGQAIRSKTAHAQRYTLGLHLKPCTRYAPEHDCVHETEKPSDYVGVFGVWVKGLNV